MVVWPAERPGLRLSRIAQPQFIGTSGLDKVDQAGSLRLPAKPSDTAIGQHERSTSRYILDIGRRQSGGESLSPLVRNDLALGNLIDQLGAEQSGRVPLRDVDTG